MGQCPGCKEWNTFAEEPQRSSTEKDSRQGASERMLLIRKTLSEIEVSTECAYDDWDGGAGPCARRRHCTGLPCFSRRRSGYRKVDVAFTGLPESFRGREEGTLYLRRGVVAADPSESGADGDSLTDLLLILCETSLETIREAIARIQPEVVIIDSIQTMYNENVSSAPGSVSQVRESTGVLMQIAKGMSITIFIVGHVTKEGVVAGPRVLEHMVDTVLYFEGDRYASYRILRGVKNRFGSTNEIGVFEMRGSGLAEVTNPSEYMLEGKPEGASGSIVACTMEGTRPVLLEVQALVCQSNLAFPRRTAAGTDLNRANLLMAVLEKRAGLRLSSCDAYINIAGGIRMNEPALDLGIALAIASSMRDMPIDEKTIAFGEIGLSGEVRSVTMAEQRVREAKKLGFTTVILPAGCKKQAARVEGIELIPVKNVREAIQAIL